MSDMALAAEDVTVKFDGLTAVDRMTVEVRPGQVVGLIGPNGAGKTTLFNALAGHQPVNGGRVFLDGADVTTLRAPGRAKRGLARTFQLVSIIPDLTARENVVLGLDHRRRIRGGRQGKRADRAEADALLADAGLAKYRNDLGGNLAEGVKRQVELLRTVAAGGQVILLDEPGAGLSEHDHEVLAGTVRGIAREGRACLLTDHSMDLVFAVCDYVHVMNFGAPLASGTPQEIKAHPKVMEAYLATGGDAQ